MTDSEKMDLLLEKVTGMEKQMDSMKKQMDSTEKQMSSMREQMDSTEKQIDSMKKQMDSMAKQIDETNVDVRDIKLAIENELRRNIQIIAEGHLDLSWNLHDAIKPSNEIEMLMVKVNMLEMQVRSLEAKIPA